MNSVTNEYTATWAAPEIPNGADTITREADVFAFGMVVIEVCPFALLYPTLKVERWVVCLMPAQGFHGRAPIRWTRNPGHYIKEYGWQPAGLPKGGART